MSHTIYFPGLPTRVLMSLSGRTVDKKGPCQVPGSACCINLQIRLALNSTGTGWDFTVESFAAYTHGSERKWYRQRILVVSKQTQSSFVQAIRAGAWMLPEETTVSFHLPAMALIAELPAHYCVKGLLLSAGALACTPEVNPL